MLTIWGRKTSSNVQALMWCVGEFGRPYQRHDVGHVHGGTDTPAFRAMNPNGTVPVLRDGDGPPLWETGAILRYLAGRYGPPSFWPATTVERATVDMWAEWAKINVTLGFTTPIFWRVVRTAPDKRDTAAIAAAMVRLTPFLRLANSRLQQHQFLASNTLTLADIQLGHILYRYFDIDLARPQLPALRRYYDALTTRPAYREHVMISYEPLRVV